MLKLIPYDRKTAVEYAHKWAGRRNPEYYDFSTVGGDCTNFASQCLYAGTGVMNYTPEFGWYYVDINDRSPSWTGVPFFWNFMTRNEPSDGPFGIRVTPAFLRYGDFVQIKFRSGGEEFSHTLIVVSVGNLPALDNILVAAHSVDADYRALSTYENVSEIRFLHILGALRNETGPQLLTERPVEDKM